MCFKLYLDNWTTDCFEIRSVAMSKVAIMISGLHLIFAQQVTYGYLLEVSFHK